MLLVMFYLCKEMQGRQAAVTLGMTRKNLFL